MADNIGGVQGKVVLFGGTSNDGRLSDTWEWNGSTWIESVPEAKLAVGDVVVAEGDGGTSTAVFTVRLSAAAANTVKVAYATVDGTAAAPGDYTATSGLLTFSPGQTFKTVPVTVKGDVVDEVDETFAVNLSSPTGATISDATGIGTIRDDD